MLLMILALSLGSCRRAAQKQAEKIRIEAVEQITPKGLTSAEAVLRIANGSAYRLQLRTAEFTLCYQREPLLRLLLHEGFELEKRTTRSVATRWRIRIVDPLALLLAGRDLQRSDASQMQVSYRLEGQGGPVPVNIAREMVPLSEFLRIFGVTLDDVKDYLR